MKKLVCVVAVVCAAVTFGGNTKIGAYSLDNAVDSDGNSAFGISSMEAVKDCTSDVAIGNSALQAASNSSSVVAIGNCAALGAKGVSSSVYIGNGEGIGDAISDTTSINGRQFFATKSAGGAWCINPEKKERISETPIYGKNGEVTFNASSVNGLFRKNVYDLDIRVAGEVNCFWKAYQDNDGYLKVTNIAVKTRSSSNPPSSLHDKYGLSFDTESQYFTSYGGADVKVLVKMSFDCEIPAQASDYVMTGAVKEATILYPPNFHELPPIEPKIVVTARLPLQPSPHLGEIGLSFSGLKFANWNKYYFLQNNQGNEYIVQHGHDTTLDYTTGASGSGSWVHKTVPADTDTVVMDMDYFLDPEGSYRTNVLWKTGSIPTAGAVRDFVYGRIGGRLFGHTSGDTKTDRYNNRYISFEWHPKGHPDENYQDELLTLDQLNSRAITFSGVGKTLDGTDGYASIQFENGGVSISTNGVRIGYFKLSPTP